MTVFEGMCIGFTAGVIGTLICVLGGALIDHHFNNHNSSDPDLPVGGRDRSGYYGQNNRQGEQRR